MARLTFAEHMAINGTAFNPTTYQGGRIAPLANLFVGSAHERDSDGTAQTAWLNMLDGIAQASRNCSKANIYKNSADTALQFSVEAFKCNLGSILCSYAGGTAVASATAGATRYIWADLSDAPAVTIGVGAAWPTTVPFLGLGSIAAPASGHWLPTDLLPVVHEQAVRIAGKQRMLFDLAFAYNTGATTPLVTLPVGATVLRCNLRVDTLFNGSSPTINIGDSGSNSRFMASATAIPGSAGNKKNDDLLYKYASKTTVNVYIGGSGASTGAATAILEVMI